MVCCWPQHVKRSRMHGPAQSATNVGSGSCMQSCRVAPEKTRRLTMTRWRASSRRPTSELLISCDQRCDDHTLTKTHLHPWHVLVVGFAGFPIESSNVDCIQRYALKADPSSQIGWKHTYVRIWICLEILLHNIMEPKLEKDYVRTYVRTYLNSVKFCKMHSSWAS